MYIGRQPHIYYASLMEEMMCIVAKTHSISAPVCYADGCACQLMTEDVEINPKDGCNELPINEK